MTTQFGEVNFYRAYDAADLFGSTDSLQADSNVVENAVLGGYLTSKKEFLLAKDGIAGFLQKYAIASYDFATHGGAISTIEIDGALIPRGAVCLPGHVIVHTAVTSGGSATIAVGTRNRVAGTDVSTTNLKTATAIGTIGAAGVNALNTAGVSLLATTDDQTITITIATAALTAGKFDVYVPYLVPLKTTENVVYR
jgi:hypothetical protein